MGQTDSVNDIRTAIRELTARAELARKEDGRGTPTSSKRVSRRNARNSASVRSRT